MYGRITIDTRGVQGAGLLLSEFSRGIYERLGRNMLPVARQLRSEMQARAPVLTGFMRRFISESQIGTTGVRIGSAASYSGFVNYGTGTNRFKGPRPFFTSVVDTMGPQAFTERFAQESVKYLNELISKYQNGP